MQTDDSSGRGVKACSRPHSIRIDPAGQVWTVDAHTSIVYKFTPEGKKLLEISVGDIPDKTNEFCGGSTNTERTWVSGGMADSFMLSRSALPASSTPRRRNRTLASAGAPRSPAVTRGVPNYSMH